MTDTGPSSNSGNWMLLVAALLAIPLAIAGVMALGDDGEDATETAQVADDGDDSTDAGAEPVDESTPEPTSEPTATPEPTATAEPTATPAPTPTAEPTPEPTPDPTPSPEPAGDPDGTRADPETVAPLDAPEDIDQALERVANGEVVESRAVVKGGRIFLFGSVPDRESANRIVALAGEILGPENVYNFYVIDSRSESASDGNIRVDDNVLFETNSAVIAEEFFPLLNQAVALMALQPQITMTVIGHTDSRGSDELNQRLSEARADSVVTYLTERGIDRSRLTAIGRGEDEPVASNNTARGRQLNRRIQVTLENVLPSD